MEAELMTSSIKYKWVYLLVSWYDAFIIIYMYVYMLCGGVFFPNDEGDAH